MSLSPQISINSAYRNSGSASSTDFNINMRCLPASYGLLSLEFVSIPATYYNVTSTNNTLVTSLGTVTIAAGSYDITALTNALATALQVVDASFGVTYNTTTLLLTITCTNAFTITYATSTLAPLLGYAANVASTKSAAGTNAVNLIPEPVLYISINELGQQSVIGGSNMKQYTFSVPVTTVTNGFIQFASNALYSELVPISFQPGSSLSIRLFDSTGTIVNLNGANWCMILKIKN